MVTGNMAVLLLSCLFACLVVAQGVSRVEYSKKIQSSSRVELATIDEKVVNASLVEKIKGMAFGTGVNLTNIRKPYVEKSMQKMIETGVNYVHVSAYARMKSVFDLTRYTSTDEKDIRYQIRLAKRNGLRVFFKPVVEPDGSWRGFIPGRDLWLRADYKSFIVDMAKLAEEEEVELFAVGSEYAQSLSNEEGWRYVVEEVRKVYSGKLTYVGNHDVRSLFRIPSYFQRLFLN